MNLEIFHLPDPSGKLSKESFLIKNHLEEYNYIVESCRGMDIPFKEKVYLCVNNIDIVPICKNPNCDKRVRFKNSTLGYLKYCSNKCISSDPSIIELKKQNSIDKFGTTSPAKSDLIKIKIIGTNNLRYGGNSPMSNSKIKEKSRNTMMSNWGFDNPSKVVEIIEKRIESFKSNVDSYKKSYKKTSNRRYGVDHPWMNKEIHSKTIDFFYQDYKKRIEDKISSMDFKFKRFEKNLSTTLIFDCGLCGEEFGILTYQFYSRINNKVSICTNCYPISENASISQIEIFNFIRSNYLGESILDHKIDRYEIDIYLPELKIGFEYNGVYWHSDKFKDNNYHFLKKEYFSKMGIDIITIWEDDWQIKSEIVKSFILNKLGRSKKIFARKCEIRRVDYPTSRLFLEHNHLQGDCKSSIRIGLFYENSLVSLMAFSKPRIALGGRQSDGSYELTRFCNLVGHIVVGGASRILKFFLEAYSPKDILSYSDNLISNGDLYEKLGFKFSHISKPGYWYIIDGIREHRFNWRKSKLVKMGFDPMKTEEEIMSENGYCRVYNGGNKKWILNIG